MQHQREHPIGSPRSCRETASASVHVPRKTPTGHTDGDSIVYFTRSKVMHMGDHMFAGMFPFIDLNHGGDVEGMTANIARIIKMVPPDVKTIPGHGPLSTLDDLKTYHAMLVETTDAVRKQMKDGKPLEEISNGGVPDKWAKKCTGLLCESSGIGLLRYLDRCRRSHASKPGGSTRLDALDTLIAYLRPRLAITDYVDYRAGELVIGSGIMESTCKHLVGKRLKGSGRQWSEGGAMAMTALIGQRINGAWEAFWTSRPIHRAA